MPWEMLWMPLGKGCPGDAVSVPVPSSRGAAGGAVGPWMEPGWDGDGLGMVLGWGWSWDGAGMEMGWE